MFSRRVALAVATSASLTIALGGAVTACSHAYAAADAPLDGGADAPLPIDASASDDGPMHADAANDAPAAPTFTELASGYSMVRAIAADDTRAYFVEEAGGGVYAVALSGGTPTKLATSAAPTSLAVSQEYVYWTDIAGGTVNRIGKAGGGVTTSPPTALKPGLVAINQLHVFALAPAPSGIGDGEIVPYSLDLVPEPFSSIPAIANPFAIAARDSAIYWTEGGPSNVVATAPVGSTMRSVVAADPDAESIAADANNVVWTSTAAGTVYASSLSAGVRAIATSEKNPTSIATDDSGVYWITSDGSIRRKRLDQELPPATIATGFVAPKDIHVRGLALTSAYVVWLTEDGRVLRVAK